jgi:hypothetical protein
MRNGNVLKSRVSEIHVKQDLVDQGIGVVLTLTPDSRHVKRPPLSLQTTFNFLVFYGLSHGTTLEKKGVVLF